MTEARGGAPSVAGRLAAVVLVWALAAAAVLGTAAFTRIGPVIYVFNEQHGVHEGDALVAVAAFVVAGLLSVGLLRRRRDVGAVRDVRAVRDVTAGPWSAELPYRWPDPVGVRGYEPGPADGRATVVLPAPRRPVGAPAPIGWAGARGVRARRCGPCWPGRALRPRRCRAPGVVPSGTAPPDRVGIIAPPGRAVGAVPPGSPATIPPGRHRPAGPGPRGQWRPIATGPAAAARPRAWPNRPDAPTLVFALGGR